MQGGWEADETVEAAAARETVEEAGVRGNLEVRLCSCSAMLCLALLALLLGCWESQPLGRQSACPQRPCTAVSAHHRAQMLEVTVCVQLQKDMVGAFPFKSNKAARKHTAEQGRCVAHMFVMHVLEELPTWPEGTERKRIWVSAHSQAAHFVNYLCYLTTV